MYINILIVLFMIIVIFMLNNIRNTIIEYNKNSINRANSNTTLLSSKLDTIDTSVDLIIDNTNDIRSNVSKETVVVKHISNRLTRISEKLNRKTDVKTKSKE